MAFRLSNLSNISTRKSLVVSAAALFAFGPRVAVSFAVVPQQPRQQQQRLESLFRCSGVSRVFASSSSTSSLQMSKRVLVPIGDGSEEIETTCVTDTLTRFGADVTVASVMPRDDLVCTMSRGIKVGFFTCGKPPRKELQRTVTLPIKKIKAFQLSIRIINYRSRIPSCRSLRTFFDT